MHSSSGTASTYGEELKVVLSVSSGLLRVFKDGDEALRKTVRFGRFFSFSRRFALSSRILGTKTNKRMTKAQALMVVAVMM